MAPETTADSPLEREVRYLKGVGPKRAEVLAGIGIHTVRDLLWHLPRGYEDRRKSVPVKVLREGDTAVVRGTIVVAEFRRTRRRYRGMVDVLIEDDAGDELSLVWFNASPKWLKSFPEGKRITVYGTVRYYGRVQMVSPDYEIGERDPAESRFGSILPVYPAAEGLTQKLLRGLVGQALEAGADHVEEVFPRAFLKEEGMPYVATALRHVHFPPDAEHRDAARRRLGYEELFVFQTALAMRRETVQRAPGIAFKVGPNVDRRIRRLFPFEFTAAQERVIGEVREDMLRASPMNRLLQGDVGCGKTVVAVYAMLAALAESSKGYQAALMAPTGILAEQHYLTLRSLLERARVRTCLLAGGLSAAERSSRLEDLAKGRIDLVVGTHALIQEDVRFRNLAQVVVDEQHRFGVRQRWALREKGPLPDVLIMTATPIPRTLAMAYLADMDVSTIDEMPPGRKPVQTELYLPDRWPDAFEAARGELERGHRVFVVYPLVEENANLDLTSAKEGFRELSERVFPEFDCCLLHGQMPSSEKQEAMDGFREGRYRVMAATTVVEVGIDIPEATVMIVQHAERLGLAQLHQLRGRIARSTRPARCFLLAEETTEQAAQRLNVLAQTMDGFRIAEEDLRLRGPGQLFGLQQSGMPEFRCYDFSDPGLLKEAHDAAAALVKADPKLERPEHAVLRERVEREYGDRAALVDVG